MLSQAEFAALANAQHTQHTQHTQQGSGAETERSISPL